MTDLPPQDTPGAAPPDEPAWAPTPAASKLSGLRQSLTGKLNLPKPGELKASLADKLAEAKAQSANSVAGQVAAGLLRQAQGVAPPPGPEPEPDLDDAEAYSREAIKEEADRKQMEAGELSRKRMAFIVAYIKNPTAKEIFSDKPLMYKVLTEERTHQHGVLKRVSDEERLLPPTPASMGLTAEDVAADPQLVAQELRRELLAKQRKQANDVQVQLFALLKNLTGVQGDTGQSAMLPPIEVAETTQETSSEDALDAAGSLLAQLKARQK